MKQNHETQPEVKPVKMGSASEPTAESQNPKTSLSQRSLAIRSNPNSTIRAKAPRADWVNTLWADISGQLRRFSVISNDLFDGLLLKRDTQIGSFILIEVRRKYEQLGDDRIMATVRVLLPEDPMGTQWQLLWTIKHHRDPNGRQFHSATTIDPIKNQPHLEIETNAVRVHSVTDFSLPPFIQDYGPGPAEFNPEPEEELDFDATMRAIMKDVDDGKIAYVGDGGWPED